MKIVAFFGTKGGTGKSTLSHLLAYGAALKGLPALADLAALPDSWLVVNRWPMTPKHPRWPKAEAYLARLPAGRILCRLGESAAADRFTESDTAPWVTLSPRVNGAARSLYSRVAARLQA